ncbi:hypothetical protein PYW07_011581 [Mythimna separata]|uniref:Fatty acyl-CoA reductase C-terminal domain-containing protein n=1 Tax=Mythimna separata TaxID=271217 RepID=A0AAD7YA29_MYTSE|nr:hypothetical protein PYW07_011581 [Mythimna separata]
MLLSIQGRAARAELCGRARRRHDPRGRRHRHAARRGLGGRRRRVSPNMLLSIQGRAARAELCGRARRRHDPRGRRHRHAARRGLGGRRRRVSPNMLLSIQGRAARAELCGRARRRHDPRGRRHRHAARRGLGGRRRRVSPNMLLSIQGRAARAELCGRARRRHDPRGRRHRHAARRGLGGRRRRVSPNMLLSIQGRAARAELCGRARRRHDPRGRRHRHAARRGLGGRRRRGALHVLSCAGARGADMIPVDVAIDTLLAVAWEAAVDDKREARVYNCSSCLHPTTWAQFRDNMLRGVRAHPFDRVLWYPFGVLIENTVMQKILATTLQTIPLHLFHYVSKLFGVKPRPSLSTVNKRLNAMNDALKFFAMREWFFSTDNVRRLKERLSPADAAVFNLDPSTIDWEDHCVDFVKGCRKYLLREKDQDIEKAQRRMHMLYMIHMATKLLLTLLLARLAIRQLPAILRAVATLSRLRKNGTALHT